jgi:hypothetical protein
LSGAACNLTAASRRQFDIVNVSAKRNRAKRQRISQIRRRIIPGRDCRSDAETVGCKNVTQLAIRIFNKGNARGPIRVVLDSDYFGGDTVLAPFEIDFAIFLFMTAADMPGCEPAVIIATAGFFLRLNQALGRPPLCDFIEARQRLEAQSRRKRAIIF